MKSGQIMVELVPPSRRASQQNVKQTIERMAALIQQLPRVDYLNVPEIVSENHAGAPFYEKMDAGQFAVTLRDKTGMPAMVNKVTVHLPQTEFDDWLDRTVNKQNIRHVVLVGGNSRATRYGGLPVLNANTRAAARNATVGNICIPDRPGELQRLLSKTKSGCSFFTTQILFKSERIKRLLGAYDAACRQKGIAPASFFLCFAPVSTPLDLEYMTWLGAHIPPTVAKRLGGHDPAEASVALAQQLYLDVLTHAQTHEWQVPVSINVEPISLKNLDWVDPMVRCLNNVRHRV